jgi:hypothetical protein
MSDLRLLRQASLFFASDKWWKPILSFIYTKCSAFYAENPTHEEFVIYQSFMKLVIDLIDNQFCRKANLAPSAFENVMSILLQHQNPHAQLIMDTVQRTTDFLEFRSEMLSCNVRTERIVSQVLSDFTRVHPEVTDPDVISVRVAKTAQAKINGELTELVRRGVTQMRALMELDHESEELKEKETEAEDIERRRRFWVKQRDILQEHEKEKTGMPNHSRIQRVVKSEHSMCRCPPNT